MQSCFVDRSALLSSLKNRCPGKQSPTGTPNFIRIGEWIATSAISFCSFIHKWQCVVNATREDLSRKCFSGGESGNGWCGPFLKKNISDWDVKRLISYVQENLCYKLNLYIFFYFLRAYCLESFSFPLTFWTGMYRSWMRQSLSSVVYSVAVKGNSMRIRIRLSRTKERSTSRCLLIITLWHDTNNHVAFLERTVHLALSRDSTVSCHANTLRISRHTLRVPNMHTGSEKTYTIFAD